MERHDTIGFARSLPGAARYLLGAGTFAAAMVAMTGSASAQTSVCPATSEGDPTFCGHVFTDTNGDGNYDDGEGVPDVPVAITDGSGFNVANSPTPTGLCPGENCGYYGFTVYEPPGTEYWICLVTDPTKADCSNLTDHPESVHVTVGEPPFHDFEVGDGGGGGSEPPLVWGVGTGTPGYWKNHPEAWPGDVTVGGVKYVNASTATAPNKTKYDAIKLMGKVGGDKTLTMFASLISAKLNTMLENNTVCIDPTIALADAWMTAHPVANPAVKASSPAWVEGEPYHQKMDDYNNGKLCAPHRD